MPTVLCSCSLHTSIAKSQGSVVLKLATHDRTNATGTRDRRGKQKAKLESGKKQQALYHASRFIDVIR